MVREELTWILGDFKAQRKDFSETILEIERLYARQLGLCHPLDVQKELDRAYKKNAHPHMIEKQ